MGVGWEVSASNCILGIGGLSPCLLAGWLSVRVHSRQPVAAHTPHHEAPSTPARALASNQPHASDPSLPQSLTSDTDLRAHGIGSGPPG